VKQPRHRRSKKDTLEKDTREELLDLELKLFSDFQPLSIKTALT
jgi:hypothetical protein